MSIVGTIPYSYADDTVVIFGNVKGCFHNLVWMESTYLAQSQYQLMAPILVRHSLAS